MIYHISKKLAYKMALATGYVEKEDYLRYGFEILIGYVIKFTILILLASFLNILPYTIALVIPFIILRLFTGGAHLKTYHSCLIFSLIWFLLLGWISSVLQTNYFLIIAAIFAVMGYLLSMLYVPVQRNEEKKKEPKAQKIKVAAILTVFNLVVIICYFIGVNPSVLLAILLGLSLQLLSITPAGIDSINKINKYVVERRGI